MEEEEKKKLKIQKITQKVLVIFVITMIILTIVSKTANSLTVPTVTVEKVARGGINYDIEGQGELMAKDDSKIDIFGGLDVIKVPVKCGEQVKEGDLLVQYDPDSIENAIAKQYQNLLSAQQDYMSKKTEYEDNLAKTQLTEAQKVAKEAQEELEKAEIDLTKAQNRYDDKMGRLTSKLKDDQLDDYERVTEEKDKASEAYEDCKKEYDKSVAKAQEALQDAAKGQGDAVKDAQRDYDSAKLAYDEYCKDFNRKNEAYLAFINSYAQNGTDPEGKYQETLLIEYFGKSTLDMIKRNDFDSMDAYQQITSDYNKIMTAIFDYENAVNARDGFTSQDGLLKADARIKETSEKIYQLIVKPYELDKVTTHEKELSVTVAKEKLDKLNADNSEVVKEANDTYNETIKQLDKELKAAEETYNKAKKAYDKVMSKVYSDTDSEDNLLATLEGAKDKRDAAKKALETAEAALTKEEKASMNEDSLLSLSEHTLKSAMLGISEIEDEIKKLEELEKQDGTLCAASDGTVTEMTVNNYTTTTGEEKIVVASDECYFRGAITKDMMDYVELGDEIDLKLNGVTKMIPMKVSKVYLDPQNNSVAYIEADLSDSGYTVGTAGNFTYQKSGETSQNCISITAIRQDGPDYYVLVPQEQNSILGDVTKASRINVRVLNKDSKTAIIEGPISTGESVITGSSKIIKDGDVVRTNN